MWFNCSGQLSRDKIKGTVAGWFTKVYFLSPSRRSLCASVIPRPQPPKQQPTRSRQHERGLCGGESIILPDTAKRTNQLNKTILQNKQNKSFRKKKYRITRTVVDQSSASLTCNRCRILPFWSNLNFLIITLLCSFSN